MDLQDLTTRINKLENKVHNGFYTIEREIDVDLLDTDQARSLKALSLTRIRREGGCIYSLKERLDFARENIEALESKLNKLRAGLIILCVALSFGPLFKIISCFY